jgi:lipopolysaccharide transport system ATP-binding protein
MRSMNPAITFDRVSKRFVLQRERARSFQDALLNSLHRRSSQREVFWALKDVSLTVQRGEMVGLIGPNGAGKSTILKMMTRILEPTSGTVTVNGRVAALLELGTGFHPDLTGRENVFLNGSLLGFGRRQMQERIGSIIEFAGIERFIDVPVRHYSSGMFMRLGFAIAVHSDPNILITDEVLAVGDEAFQAKCLERMSQFRDEGVTIILVSHALSTVRTLCDRVVWLRQGLVIMDGETEAVADAYVADVTTHAALDRHDNAGHGRADPLVAGLADLHLLGVELIAPNGEARWRMQAGERMTLRLHYQARQPFPEAVVALQVHDADDHTLVTGLNTHSESIATPIQAGKGSLDLSDVALPLRNGSYLVTVALFRQPNAPHWANPDAIHRQAYTLRVTSPLTAPQRRWGTGEALVEGVCLCNADDVETRDFLTGATMRLHLRCKSVDTPVTDAVLRVQIRDGHGALCHATNSERNCCGLGTLTEERTVELTYEHLDLLEGEYTVSVGLTPATQANRPYDWHDAAYRFSVHSDATQGLGIVNLRHRWTLDE